MANLLHLANVLYFVSYSVRDILWLRCFTVAGLFMCMPYYVFRESPLWPPFAWHVVFVMVNGFQIGLLIRDRMPIDLNADEAMLHSGAFRMLSPQQVRKVANLGQWHEAKSGDCIVAERQPLDHLILLHAGRAHVRVEGRVIAELTGGQFVGEMSFLTQELTSAEVVATGPVRYLAWSGEAVDPDSLGADLYLAVQSALGIDLVNKLKRMRRDEA